VLVAACRFERVEYGPGDRANEVGIGDARPARTRGRQLRVEDNTHAFHVRLLDDEYRAGELAMLAGIHDPAEQRLELAQLRRPGDVEHLQRFPRQQIAEIETDALAYCDDLEQRCPRTLKRNDRSCFAGRQRARTLRNEAIDQTAPFGAPVAVVSIGD